MRDYARFINKERIKMARYEIERNFLKTNFNKLKSIKTDKMKGLPQPEGIKRYN